MLDSLRVKAVFVPAMLGVLALSACGGRGASSDGGADGPPTDASLAGRQEFDVVATLGVADAGGGPTSGLPASSTFTLVLDPGARQAIVGGLGHGATVAATSSDGKTFKLDAFSVGVASGGACEGASTIDFKSFEITLSGPTLRGQGSGAAQVSCGDCFFSVPFVANVSGTADTTAPFFLASGVAATSPFSAMTFVANEPLPPSAKAHLVTPSGDRIELEPWASQAEPSLVLGFSKPNVVLPAADGFSVALDELIDFAGNHGDATASLRIGGFAAPPLVAGDGFETAPGPQVGGAALLGPTAPLMPITGMHSVYIGGSGAPPIPGATFGTALRVRLAVRPGVTKLRFAYRTVAGFGGLPAATVYVGSVGHEPATAESLPISQTMSRVTWTDGTVVGVGEIVTKEVALPADVTDEVVVAIDVLTVTCGGPAPPPAGLQIDDLQLE